MIRKQLLVLILILPLGACSTFGLFYNHLPFFTTWRVDDMFDLNNQQKELVEESTEEIKSWLSREAFPTAIIHLKEAKVLWQEKRFNDAAIYFDHEMQKFIQAFLENVSPYLIELLLSLDNNNVEEYLDYNQEKSEDWFSYAESKETKIRSRIERLENWFGRLTPLQEERVAKIVTLLPEEQEIRLNNNQYWVEKVVKASLSRDKLTLQAWLDDTSKWWTEDYKQLRAKNRSQTFELIDMMIETMTTDQQEHVIDVVNDWIEKLEDLD